jgi:hypothetical protein
MRINHGKLDGLLGRILDGYKSREMSRSSAIGEIAHLIAAVEKGNETEVRSCLNEEGTFERCL